MEWLPYIVSGSIFSYRRGKVTTQMVLPSGSLREFTLRGYPPWTPSQSSVRFAGLGDPPDDAAEAYPRRNQGELTFTTLVDAGLLLEWVDQAGEAHSITVPAELIEVPSWRSRLGT